jgi:hypothetical protein
MQPLKYPDIDFFPENLIVPSFDFSRLYSLFRLAKSIMIQVQNEVRGWVVYAVRWRVKLGGGRATYYFRCGKAQYRNYLSE